MKHISAIIGPIGHIVDIRKHYALWPTRLASGKYLWLSTYYVIVRFTNILSIRDVHEERYSYDEYIALKLAGKIDKTLTQKLKEANIRN